MTELSAEDRNALSRTKRSGCIFYGITDKGNLVELGSIYLPETYLAGIDERAEDRTVRGINQHLKAVYGTEGSTFDVAQAAYHLLKLYKIRKIVVLAKLLETMPDACVVDTLLKDKTCIGKTLREVWSMSDELRASFLSAPQTLEKAVTHGLAMGDNIIDFSTVESHKVAAYEYERVRRTLHPVVDVLPDKTQKYLLGFEAGMFFKNLMIEITAHKNPKNVRFKTRVHKENVSALRTISNTVNLELYVLNEEAPDTETEFCDVVVAHLETLQPDRPI